MDPIVLRLVERVLLALLAAGCIYLGYRLFRQGQVQAPPGDLEVSGGLTVKLKRVAPGVLFAALGAGVLGLLASSPIEVSAGGGYKYFMEGEHAGIEGLRPIMRTLTSVENLLAQAEVALEDEQWRTIAEGVLSESGKQTLRALIDRRNDLQVAKLLIVSPFYSKVEMRTWKVFGNNFETQSLKEEEAQHLREIQTFMNEGLDHD